MNIFKTREAIREDLTEFDTEDLKYSLIVEFPLGGRTESGPSDLAGEYHLEGHVNLVFDSGVWTLADPGYYCPDCHPEYALYRKDQVYFRCRRCGGNEMVVCNCRACQTITRIEKLYGESFKQKQSRRIPSLSWAFSQIETD